MPTTERTPPASDYGVNWITGRTKNGLVIHTVLKRRASGLTLYQSPSLCGRRVAFFLPTEDDLHLQMRGYPLCKRCDEWMS